MRRLTAFLLITALAANLTGCANRGSDATVMKKLQAVEVREYKGKKLSSIAEFQENSIKGPQVIDKQAYRLTVDGLVDRSKLYTYDQVVKKHGHYTKVVTLDCVEGWSVTILWEGVLVKDLLKDAGVKPTANTVIFHAHDGYTTSFPLAYLLKSDIIVAYKMNNVTLPPERGFPFQLVAEQKWGYKWVKWIERIELSDDKSYRGYWESRGYSNEGDLNKSFFGK